MASKLQDLLTSTTQEKSVLETELNFLLNEFKVKNLEYRQALRGSSIEQKEILAKQEVVEKMEWLTEAEVNQKQATISTEEQNNKLVMDAAIVSWETYSNTTLTRITELQTSLEKLKYQIIHIEELIQLEG